MPSIPSTTSPGVSTGTIASSRIVVPMHEEILELDPIKRQLLMLLSMIGVEETQGPVDQWHEEDRAQIFAFVDGEVDFSGTADGSTATVLLNTSQASIFKINHVVYARVNVGDAGNFRALVIGVDTSANTVTLRAVVADSGALPGNTIANECELMIIGSSYQEGSSRSASLAVQPTVDYNYVQLERDSWAATDYMQATEVYGDPEFMRLANRATLRQLQDVENSLWWGIRRVSSPVGGATHEGRRSNAAQPRWMTGGVFWRITTNVTVVGTGGAALNLGNLTYADFVNYLQDMAVYNPMETFTGFFGPDFMSRVSNPEFLVGATNGPVSHDRPILDQTFGFNIKRLETTHGAVVLMPGYESFHQRTLNAAAAAATNTLDILGAVLYMRKMRLTTLPGKGVGMLRTNLQDNGDNVRIDGLDSYFGLRMPNERHHMEMLFTSNT